MEQKIGEYKELNLFMTDGKVKYKPISLSKNILEAGEDVILCGISTADNEPNIQKVAEPIKLTITVNTDKIKDALAFLE